MKILQGMDNIASQGFFNALGLRAIGEDATFYTLHDTKFRQRCDCNLNIRRSNVILYPLYVVKLLVFFVSSCVKFDVFHFHFGRSILPWNLDLPILRALKKRIIMEYHGGDIRWQLLSEKGERNLDVEPLANKQKKKRIQRVFKYSECIILHDSELRPFLVGYSGDVAYVPLRLDIDNFIPIYPNANKSRPVIVHAPSKRSIKGTEYIQKAIEKLKEKYEFDYCLVENMTNEEAKKVYASADIIIDQLKVGTYGVLSVEGMALGKPVICYIMDSIKSDFPKELPIVSATVNNIAEKIEGLLIDGELRRKLGIAGRHYVERYHNYRYNAYLLKEIYNGNCRNESQRESFERVCGFSKNEIVLSNLNCNKK